MLLSQLYATKNEISESTGDGLDYFREDVGLNTFNYNWILHWPSWMDRTAYNATNWYRTGEQFYYYHQQILASKSGIILGKGIGTGIGNPLTSLRDPAYYVVLDWITTFVQEFKKHNLPPYTKEELSFDGIKIDEFTVNDTETYFDYFVIDASKGLEPWKKGYKVRQKRLNHTPIQVRLNITNSNDEDKGALIRIFIGPFHHHSGITFDMSRQMFYELDRFPNTLKVGENIITRNEDDFTSLVDDDLNDRSSHLSKLSGCGLPRRLAVPQGKKDGLVLLMYAMISPFPEFPESLTWTTDAEVQRLCEQNMFLDNRAMGFPFDRLVTNHKHWSSDNHETTNITIYHRD
ncbi:hypothetical protein AAG570_014073 [Ranatra chinensis]|uniref:Uncharacterized protein n=1 Tax=Ranatra chinensis TaxID=642074 RepID=A0ABD0YDR7_9HEMI